jgi:hydroxypyruvate isomerase
MKRHFTVSRRELFGSGAAVMMAAHAPLAAAEAPPYKLSINIEIMFPRNMPRAQRMEAVAAHGMKAFSFWGASQQEQQEMVRVQKRTGLICASIAGSGSIGRTTGLTKTGYEEAYLDVIRQNCLIARRFGCACMIVFAGQTQKEIPWDRQYAQIVGGLRKAGDIGRDYGVYVCLEPLNRVESPEMTVLTATDGFQIVHDVNHPNVKLCFDMYHLQLSEGNLTNNLKRGLENNWIYLVQLGDVPGRKEPGTGEVNYGNILRVLRKSGYRGYLDTEYGTTSTPEYAMDVVRRLASEN